MALVDINALIRHRDKEKPDAPHAKAVFVLFNQAGYSIIARKSRGIQTLADLPGKSLGVVEGDPAAKLWPAVARQNGIKTRRHQAERDQPGGARADALGRTGRRGDRLLLSCRRSI